MQIYLLKGRYILRFRPPTSAHRYLSTPDPCGTDTQCFLMLRYKNISKEISHGALDMLYSEGNFRFSIDFSVHGILVLPSQLTNRVKNVEFVFHGHSEWHSQKFRENPFLHTRITLSRSATRQSRISPAQKLHATVCACGFICAAQPS